MAHHVEMVLCVTQMSDTLHISMPDLEHRRLSLDYLGIVLLDIEQRWSRMCGPGHLRERRQCQNRTHWTLAYLVE